MYARCFLAKSAYLANSTVLSSCIFTASSLSESGVLDSGTGSYTSPHLNVDFFFCSRWKKLATPLVAVRFMAFWMLNSSLSLRLRGDCDALLEILWAGERGSMLVFTWRVCVFSMMSTQGMVRFCWKKFDPVRRDFVVKQGVYSENTYSNSLN